MTDANTLQRRRSAHDDHQEKSTFFLFLNCRRFFLLIFSKNQSSGCRYIFSFLVIHYFLFNRFIIYFSWPSDSIVSFHPYQWVQLFFVCWSTSWNQANGTILFSFWYASVIDLDIKRTKLLSTTNGGTKRGNESRCWMTSCCCYCCCYLTPIVTATRARWKCFCCLLDGSVSRARAYENERKPVKPTVR